MAQIKAGSSLANPKSINVYKNGVWQKKRVGYVFHNGEWMPFINYLQLLYEEGIEHIPIYTGVFNGYAEKENDHIMIQNTQSYSGGAAWAYTGFVDLTNYNYLCVDWDSDGDSSTEVFFGVKYPNYEPNQSNTWFLANYTNRYPGFNREIRKLDISDIIGEHKLQIAVRATSSRYNANTVRIFNFWLE